jgi:TolB-like protein
VRNDGGDGAAQPPLAASIAVLPFVDEAADQEYLADGIAEEI